ncbi:MAG: GtrA family protein [Bacteroidetes bacterium]|nr:GtrA family protein [Bacteroidota bacterium]
MLDFLTKTFLLKFLKFGAVGFSGLLVDYGFTYIFKEIFKVQKYISNSIGFTLAATSNYVFNRIWTFKSTNPDIALEYGEFLVISLIGLGINNLILYLIVSRLKWNFYLAKLVAIGVVTVWNFLANFFITFNQGI